MIVYYFEIFNSDDDNHDDDGVVGVSGVHVGDDNMMVVVVVKNKAVNKVHPMVRKGSEHEQHLTIVESGYSYRCQS